MRSQDEQQKEMRRKQEEERDALKAKQQQEMVGARFNRADSVGQPVLLLACYHDTIVKALLYFAVFP